ncbi:hypothetical protein ACQP2X_27490 [Actinoplanes sp. CA-131856]
MELFEASRYRYVFPPDGDGVFCVGNVGECDGEARIPWNGSPSEPALVRALDVAPSAAQLRRPRLPEWLGDLPRLESLTVPAALIGLLGDGVPRTLVIHGEGETPVALPGHVRGILYVGSDLSRVVDPLPPLEFLRTEIDGLEGPREQLRALSTLRHLELVGVRNDDVLADIRSPLETLEIAGSGRRFSMAGLPPSLKVLRLNGIRAEIDCALLAGFDELDVLNSRKFANLDAILGIPRVRFVNCGNPFRGRPEFRERGFDVDYA